MTPEEKIHAIHGRLLKDSTIDFGWTDLAIRTAKEYAAELDAEYQRGMIEHKRNQYQAEKSRDQWKQMAEELASRLKDDVVTKTLTCAFNCEETMDKFNTMQGEQK